MISRNILATNFLPYLKAQKDLKIVILAPKYKVEYFKRMLGSTNVIIEGVDLYQASRTFLGLMFKKLGVMLFNTRTARNRKKYEYLYHRKFGLYLASRILGSVSRFTFVRAVVRALDLRFCPQGYFLDLLEKYQPDLVFSTDLQNENDVSLLQDAKRRKIKIVGMVRSWDNPTQRIFRILPDRLVVGSKELFDEILALYKYPAEKITITGNPHYDRYLAGPTKAKADFLKSFGLSLERRLIVYAPVSDALIKFNDIDQYVMSLLGKVEASVIVRFPAEKGVRLDNFEKPANMVFHRTGQSFNEKVQGDREITPADDESLINELFYADLVITGPTSIAVDAPFMDRPTIAVNFYPTHRNFFETVYSYKCDHIQKVLETGGVHYSDSVEDFFEAVETYLENPAKDHVGRLKIKQKWFSHADGRAGERLSQVILNEISPKS